jgi:GrpB-like predicted nucleotidyltransferase (UPF0157 family)/GNAT superfamily N-acetyltransferase
MKVEVVPYNPEWKNKYSAEAELIQKACGENILIIEHAGSTSVEGLAAKPIIDIYIGTKSLAEAENMIIPMIYLGYEYVKDFEDELPFRRYFRKDIDGKRSYHVHVTPAPHIFRNSDLMFRDYISVNPVVKKEYEELKLKLSQVEWKTSLDYNEAKSELCKRIKQEALAYFGNMFEQTESYATFLTHIHAPEETQQKAKFTMLREGSVTAIRTDIFPGFSLNRVLGITEINEPFLDKIEEFYEGHEGKFALQIPPNILDDNKILLLTSRGYTYSNSWITFYRDTSPIETRGTDLTIKEIGKEHALEFGHMLNEVFSFPHEFDEIAGSTTGAKDWVTFMAFDGDIPAGSASVCITGETAYFSFAHVLPEYRRRGVQAELMKKRIDSARVHGAKWVFVDTAESSEENPNPSYWNMLRYGFRLMYNRPNYVKILP